METKLKFLLDDKALKSFGWKNSEKHFRLYYLDNFILSRDGITLITMKECTHNTFFRGHCPSVYEFNFIVNLLNLDNMDKSESKLSVQDIESLGWVKPKGKNSYSIRKHVLLVYENNMIEIRDYHFRSRELATYYRGHCFSKEDLRTLMGLMRIPVEEPHTQTTT